MIGFTTLLENIKYTVTLGTSYGIYPPAVIIKAFVVGGPHVTKKKQTIMKQLFETWLSVQWNHTISHDIGVDVINTCFLSPFDKFSNSSEVPHKL